MMAIKGGTPINNMIGTTLAGGRPAPIGIGKPLTIRMKSIFTGAKDGALLVTSSVRDPMLSAAGVKALHYVKKHVDAGSFVEAAADEQGFDVVYYSPSTAQDELTVFIKLTFDIFDQNGALALMKSATQALSLPLLIGGTAVAGPAGGAGSQACRPSPHTRSRG